MLLTLIGLGLPAIGVAGVVIGLKKKERKIWITSIVIPIVYWVGFYFLWEADRKFIEEETEKNRGETTDWVW